MQELDLSIVIVNWNSASFVRKCLVSIYENTKAIRFEIIVVDNASNDGCGQIIEKEFPGVRFIQSSENRGFAHANNLGFQSSCGRNLLFLNPDTEIVGPAIEQMVEFLDATADAGVVGAKLLNSDNSIQTSCIQRYPTLLNQILDNEFLRRAFPKSSFWGTRPLYCDFLRPVSVEVISGACQMLRRRIFSQVGLYDSEYFMYAEDVDLCFKVQKAGWQNYYLGRAEVVHHGGQSSSSAPKSQFSTLMMSESLARFFKKQRGAIVGFLFRPTMAAVSVCRIGLLGALLALTVGQYRRERMIAGITKWSAVFRWAIGLENSARPFAERLA